jgi:SAM-dependent methyltransferase
MSGFTTRRVLLSALAGSLLSGQEKSRMFADAEAYDRFMGRWSRLVARLLIDFAGVPEAGTILDVGSGTGSLAFEIAARRPKCQVVGVDPSPEYVAYAKDRSRSGRARFEVGDAQQLALPNATFDASVSLLVFNFIPDPKKALLEVRRVTKPGGSVSAAVWDYGVGMRMLRVFWNAVVALDPTAERQDERHMPLCRAGELSQLWKQGGLERVEERALDITMRFVSFDDYWSPFLLGQGPAGAYVKGLAQERLPLLRAEVKRRLALSSETGPFTLKGRVWAVRGSVPKN